MIGEPINEAYVVREERIHHFIDTDRTGSDSDSC